MTDTPDIQAPSRLQELFIETLEYLQERCGDDDVLLKRVKTLLAEDGRSFDPLEEGVDLLIQEAIDEKLRELQEGLHVRCPHCRNPIEMLNDQQWSKIDCPSCGSTFSLTAAEDTILGERSGKHEQIAHFTLNEQVGVGAFGTVWNATDTELDRTVALKIPRKGQLSADESEKFLREARAAAQLKHPNIVSVHEVGRDGETVYIVSDFIKGLSLADWLTGQKPTFREAAELCVKVCDALQHAHSHGVIHRDLKPGNILLDQDFHPHLTDFGLAKRDAGEITMTLDGQILGTPAYMSPEQARGEGHAADARSDVYSVGVILFELLTGERPFRGNTRMLLHQLLNEAAPSPRKLDVTVPKDLETICLKCLEKDPDKRYASAKELQSDLQCFLDQRPIAARPIGRIERGWRWCKRKPAIASLTVMVLVLLLILGVGGPIVAFRQSVLANRLTDELRISKVVRLAAQSRSIRSEFPVRSLLMAVEAVESTHQHDGTILPIARENLFDVVDHVGGKPCVGHDGQVLDVAISPDSRWMATGSADHTARLWNLTSDDPAASSIVLRGHTEGVGSVAFSADDRWLATGSADHTARLWELTIEGPANSLELPHDGPVSAVAFSPDGRSIATLSILIRERPVRHTLRLYNLSADDPSTSFKVLREQVGSARSVAFSPDGHWLVVASGSDAWLWDLTSDDAESSPQVLKGHERGVYSVAFSPDSHWLATGDIDHTTRLWDLTSDDPAAFAKVLEGRTGWVCSMAFSPDGRWLATANSDKTARLWDVTANDPGKSPLVLRDHEGPVFSATFSPDGRWLATGSWDNTARLWDLTADDPAASSIVLQGHEGDVDFLAFSTDGRWLATAGQEKTVRLWKMTDGQPAVSPNVLQGHDSSVFCVAYSPDGSRLATANGLGTVQLWELTVDPPVAVRVLEADEERRLLSVVFSPDGRWLATGGDDKTVKLWDLTAEDPDPFLMLEGTEPVFSPDGRWLAAEYDENTARVWDLTADDPAKAPIMSLDHDAMLRTLAFRPDGHCLVTVTYDGKTQFWDLKTDHPAKFLVLEEHESQVLCISFSSDGRWLATGSTDGSVRTWDLTADNPATSSIVLEGHDGEVFSVAFSPDGQWLASGSRDSTTQLWDLRADDPETSCTILRGHELTVWSVAFSPDGRWLATGSYDGTTRLWDLDIDSLIERARRAAGRELTPEERKQYMLDQE